MKKISVIIFVIILLCGCKKSELNTKKSDSSNDMVDYEKIEYKDLNNTPIGIYNLKGNTLTKVNNIYVRPIVEGEIGTFQIYPSNEEVISLNSSFAESYHDEWIKYQNIKLGFNIKFSLINGEKISYNIYGPENTFDKWEYLMNYLYDDYANLGKGFYSHVETDQVNENTLYTAFKMQSSYSIDQINSKIEFSVFTYDSDDDFLNGEYRGNSSYKIDICLENRPC